MTLEEAVQKIYDLAKEETVHCKHNLIKIREFIQIHFRSNSVSGMRNTENDEEPTEWTIE